MILIGLIPVLHATHHLSMGTLLVLATAIGVASVLFDVSWMSFVPTVVKEPKQYVEANQKLGVTSSCADVAGPGVAGAVISALSAPTALAADAFSYLFSLATLLWIRTPEAKVPPTRAERRLRAELSEGLRFVFGDRILRPLALIAPFCNFVMVGVWTMFLLYASRSVGLSSAQIGVVFASSSVGGLVGAAVSRRLITQLPARRGVRGLDVGHLPRSAVDTPRRRLAAGAAGDVHRLLLPQPTGSRRGDVIMISLRQTCTPPPLMGRMNAAFRTMLFGGGSLGALFGGFIADAFGLRTSIIAVAIGSAVMVLPVLLSPVSRLRAMPDLGKVSENMYVNNCGATR